MKTTTENNTLTIYLDGRIDTNNAGQTEKEIFDAIGDNTNIVIDAENLEYISSAGLRVLMKLRKTINKPLPVINVSRDVYDIFETTGFTELLDVKKALRKVSVEGCEEIGSGGYGTVYRLDEETILKVYYRGSLDLIERERLMSKRAFVSGLPTAIAYDVVRIGDKYGVVYEMLNAKTAAQLITEEPSRLEEYVGMTARGLKQFNAVELDDELFPDKKKLFHETIDIAAPYLNSEEEGLLRGYIDGIPDRKTFLHGDYNFKNVMINNDELMLIDIGDAAVGHPVFDLAGVLGIHLFAKNPTRPRDMVRHLLGFDPDLSGKVWETFCSAYFGTSSPAETEHYTQMITPLAVLLLSYHALRISAGESAEVIKQRVDKLLRDKLPLLKNAPKIDF